MTCTLITGAGGFIGGHLVSNLVQKAESNDTLVCVDIKPLKDWWQLHEHPGLKLFNLHGDASSSAFLAQLTNWFQPFDHVYNLACDMGGMGFIESHKLRCMLSVDINSNLIRHFTQCATMPKNYFYASSACVYPDYRQSSNDMAALKEEHAYPAMPEDGYGWEKLFSERLCQKAYEEFGLPITIARFHNVYGPNGTWTGGREKAPAALCRKVAEAVKRGEDIIEVWGDGTQKRSFMYIDDCIEGIDRLVASGIREPINLGSSEAVTIDQLLEILERIVSKQFNRRYLLNAPKGVAGRNSDNTKIKKLLDWEPCIPLEFGMLRTYRWIFDRVLGA